MHIVPFTRLFVLGCFLIFEGQIPSKDCKKDQAKTAQICVRYQWIGAFPRSATQGKLSQIRYRNLNPTSPSQTNHATSPSANGLIGSQVSMTICQHEGIVITFDHPARRTPSPHPRPCARITSPAPSKLPSRAPSPLHSPTGQIKFATHHHNRPPPRPILCLRDPDCKDGIPRSRNEPHGGLAPSTLRPPTGRTVIGEWQSERGEMTRKSSGPKSDK